MIQKLRNNIAPAYEILDYIITPSSSEVNTEVLVNGTTVVEMTCMLRQRSWQAPRFFSSNDTNTDAPGWNQAGTWGLQFEDNGNNLSIKMLGADYSRLSDAVIVRTGITYNDLSNKKLRYNLTAAGILTIFNTDDTVFRSYDATAETDTSVTSSTPIKLFHRYASYEFINNGTYVYDVKIWDNDVLIRHYLPVKRLSDNIYGLYDIINNTFHSNEISGYNFSGASKSTPEYIYDTVSGNNYVNDILLHKQGVLVHKYEVLDYVSCTRSQYFDTDIYAQSGISVEMTCKMTSRPGNTRFFSTHDPRDTSEQNWAFASGCWGLQFEGNTMCIKMLGNNNNISSFAMTSVKFSSVSGHKYLYDLSCDGILNIYEPSDNSLWYTFDCIAGTDTTKVSQTTIRMFGREAAEQSEWFYGDVYDVKIKNNGTIIRHYIPVKRLSDNAIGFYETETEMFLTSASGTNFSGTSKAVPEYIDATTSQTIHINKIYLNGEVYWGNEPEKGGLPARYVQVDYIMNDAPHYRSNNASQVNNNMKAAYIDTNYFPKVNTRVVGKIELPANRYYNFHYNNIFLFGGHSWQAPGSISTAGSAIFGLYFYYNNTYVGVQRGPGIYAINNKAQGYNNNGADFTTMPNMKVNDDLSHMIEFEIGPEYLYEKIDDIVYIDQAPTGPAWPGIDGSSNTSTQLYLFSGVLEPNLYHWPERQPIGWVQQKLYYFKIYEGNTLVKDYVPVYDTMTDKYGLYDMVDKEFLTSPTSYDFIYE